MYTLIFFLLISTLNYNLFCMDPEPQNLQDNLIHLKNNLNGLKKNLSSLSDKLQKLSAHMIPYVEINDSVFSDSDMATFERLDIFEQLQKNKSKLIKLKFNLIYTDNLTYSDILKNLLEIPENLILDFSNCKKLTKLDIQSKNTIKSIDFTNTPIKAFRIYEAKIQDQDLKNCLQQIQSSLKELTLELPQLNMFDFSNLINLTNIGLLKCQKLLGEESRAVIVDLSDSKELEFENINIPNTTHAKIIISNETYTKWFDKKRLLPSAAHLYDNYPLAIFFIKEQGKDCNRVIYKEDEKDNKSLDGATLLEEINNLLKTKK